MDTYKLHIKIGSNEFDAEGPTEVVTAQFEVFKELIRSSQTEKEHKEIKETSRIPFEESAEQLDKLFNNDAKGHIISLKIVPTAGKRHVLDCILLILFGHKLLRKEEQVLSTQLRAALDQSGITVDRIDGPIEVSRREGLILKAGVKKGSNYRLTNKGIAEAEKLVQGILEQIPKS